MHLSYYVSETVVNGFGKLESCNRRKIYFIIYEISYIAHFLTTQCHGTCATPQISGQSPDVKAPVGKRGRYGDPNTLFEIGLCMHSHGAIHNDHYLYWSSA